MAKHFTIQFFPHCTFVSKRPKDFGKLSHSGSGVWMQTVREARPSLRSMSDGVYILQFSPLVYFTLLLR